jgi:hypothetical protein
VSEPTSTRASSSDVTVGPAGFPEPVDNAARPESAHLALAIARHCNRPDTALGTGSAGASERRSVLREMGDHASLSEVLFEYGQSQRLAGVPPERMVVTIKSIAVNSGADLTITGPDQRLPMTDIVGWSIEGYYST